MHEVLMKWCVLIIPIPYNTPGRYQVAIVKVPRKLEGIEVAKLDGKIRNEELGQDHLEMYDCMQACIKLVASFQSVSNLVRSTLHPPSY